MRILFVVPYAPNPVRTRPYNLVRRLARSHEVTLLTLTGNSAERDDLSMLEGVGITVISESLTRGRSLASCVAALPTRDPLQAAYCRNSALLRRLDDLLREGPGFDVVHVEHLRGARYALAAKQATAGQPSAPPVVWDSVDCISHLFRQAATQSTGRFSRWVTRLELPRTERFEGWLAWQFDAVLTTSAADRRALLDLATRQRPTGIASDGLPDVRVLPNGVDLDVFRPDPVAAREPAMVVLSGKMSYHANVTMAVYLVREVMPQVWARRPDARVCIVGKDPPQVVRALSGSRVDIKGAVPDMAPYLQRATVAAAPMAYGAGIQNKVLEAMACATPVVTTPQAAAALAAVPGRDLLVGSDARDLAAQIVALLENPTHAAAVGAAGRAYVEQNHCWDDIVAMLVGLYRALQGR